MFLLKVQIIGPNMIIKVKVVSLDDCLFWNILKIFCLKVEKIKFDREKCCNILLCKHMFNEPPSKYVMFKKCSIKKINLQC
jgi:hypothetical protein